MSSGHRISRCEDALAKLRGYLLKNNRPLNSRLPAERELAAGLGVSRAALREALALLEAEGAIWRHVGQGTFVGNRPLRNERDLIMASGGTSPAELMEVRGYLEPLIARLAAVRATPIEIRNMQQALRRSEAAVELPAYELWDGTLHRLIAEAAHNSLLLVLFDAVNAVRTQAAWGRMQRLALSSYGARRYWEHHCGVVGAIAQRDALMAEKLMRVHIDTVRANMFGTDRDSFTSDKYQPRNGREQDDTLPRSSRL
ncbi:MAG: FadR/GntR family transcriptional regulator [Dongiaceae bacterium]